jgi:hypothetical protein
MNGQLLAVVNKVVNKGAQKRPSKRLPRALQLPSFLDLAFTLAHMDHDAEELLEVC